MSKKMIKRSSVHHIQAHHHAKFAERHGWEIAIAYSDPEKEKSAIKNNVALADQSWLGKLECKGEWISLLEGKNIESAKLHKLIPSHAVWIVQPHAIEAAYQNLESDRASKPRSYLLDNSCLYATFDLLGPKAADVLCKLSAVQVAPGNHTQAPVAGVHCLVIRDERGFQFHFAREFGEYLWECFLDAGAEFDIHPVGVDALV